MSFERDPERHARWRRIAAHAMGGDDARFIARVARANAWTPGETSEVVEEYRRFAFLACLGEEVTPSKAVDAVWHEHLVHTRDYWLEFCPQVLGAPLHHTPGGQPQDAARFAAQYERTLREYERWFGTPPARWWPRRKPPSAPETAGGARSALAATPRSRRTMSAVLGLAAIPGSRRATSAAPGLAAMPGPRRAMSAAPGLSAMPGSRRAMSAALGLAAIPAFALAAARPVNPLDWSGPEFLTLYVGLLVALTLLAFILRAVLQAAAAPAVAPGRLGVLDTAYLAGGAARCVDAAVAELHEHGALHWNREQRRGLWQRADDLRRIGLWSASPLLLLLGLGLAKIAVGLQRDRPVAALAALCVVTAVLVVVLIFKRSGPTRAGRIALERRRAEHRASGRGRRDLGLAVALAGTALLADTALAGYHDLRRPPNDTSSSSDSSSSSGSDSGDGGGGSSCGGCGGGGGD